MKKIPDLGFWKLWNISFGFFGVQIAYALQSANISRIFSVSIRPRACFFPLFSFLPLWLHYNLNPLCVQY